MRENAAPKLLGNLNRPRLGYCSEVFCPSAAAATVRTVDWGLGDFRKPLQHAVECARTRGWNFFVL